MISRLKGEIMFGKIIYYDKKAVAEYKSVISGKPNLEIEEYDVSNDKGIIADLKLVSADVKASKSYKAKVQESDLYDCDLFEKMLIGRDDYFDFTISSDYDITTVPNRSIIKMDGYIEIPEDFDMMKVIDAFKPFILNMNQFQDMEEASRMALQTFLGSANAAKIPLVFEGEDTLFCSKIFQENMTISYEELSEIDENITILARVTVEVLLENGCVPNVPSVYPNDYVFSLDDIKNKLVYLLATTSDGIQKMEVIYKQFIDMLKKHNISEEEHINLLKRTEKIETRIRNVIGYINLHRTDVVHCTCCNVGKLYFKDKNYRSTNESERASKHFFLGCSNYGNKKIKCEAGLIYVDKNKDSSLFKEIKPDSIAHRNNWGDEKVTKTILDEIESLNSTNQNLCIELESVKKENEQLKEALSESKRKNDNQEKKIMNCSAEIERVKRLEEKLSCFKKIFGRIYFLKD